MGERVDRLPTGSPDYVRRWSRLAEVLTGYDSIATVEHLYEDVKRPGVYVCVFPGCSLRRRSAEAMWRHVHGSRKHGFSFARRKRPAAGGRPEGDPSP